jgi:hypothetical protein
MPLKWLEPMIRLVGDPQPIRCPGAVAFGLKRVPFDPAVMKLIYDLKLGGVSDSNPLPLDEILVPSYFYRVGTPEAVKWLLELVGDEESRKQLMQANKKTENLTPLLEYLHDDKPQLMQALVDHFGDDSDFLFSFPHNHEAFLSFFQFCADSEDLELFKRGVEATGPPNIAPDIRAMVLGSLCKQLLSDTMVETRKMLDYWVDVVSEGPEPDFYSPSLERDTFVLLQMAEPHHNASRLNDVWVKFRPMIVRQLRDKKRQLSTILVALSPAVSLSEPQALSVPMINFYFEFFEEVARIASEAGHCTTALILSVILDRRLFRMPGVEDALEVCRHMDFSAENTQRHSEHAATLAAITLEKYNPENISKLISLWIDYSNEESLGLRFHMNRNIVDTVCLESVAPHLVDLEALLYKKFFLSRLSNDHRSKLDPHLI